MEIAATSTEFVHVNVQITIAGGAIASAVPPSLAFLPASTADNPQPTDWLTGEWNGTQARILVGPNGGVLTLDPGKYKLWIKFAAGLETPVYRAGPVTVY